MPELLKVALTHVGRRCSTRTIHRLNATIDYLAVGRWMADRGFDATRRVRSRVELFERAASELADRPVLYLEFGVYEGESMRIWSRLLRHPDARLHGFDTFTGLPGRWNDLTEAGTFSTEGRPPAIDDPRVRFFKGLFDETLPTYSPPPADTLFVNVDCDLYSSATTVLEWVEPHLRPGSYLYFDEFSNRAHELRAFGEFLDRTGFAFTLLGATRTLAQVLFQCQEVPTTSRPALERALQPTAARRVAAKTPSGV
jgi:Methyltransferase domain